MSGPPKPETCPICGEISSHDHCVECQAKNAMPWDHAPTCSHYRPATDFDTPAARRAVHREAAPREGLDVERLTDAAKRALDFAVAVQEFERLNRLHEAGPAPGPLERRASVIATVLRIALGR